MAGFGARLRALRQQWRLSLREVEQHSRRIARERGDLSYKVSASWLKRLESDEHEFTVHKLITLAEIYSIPARSTHRLHFYESTVPERSAFQPERNQIADRRLTEIQAKRLAQLASS